MKYKKITVQNPYWCRQGGRSEVCFSPGEGEREMGGGRLGVGEGKKMKMI